MSLFKRDLIAPVTRLAVSEWADKNRVLSPKSSAESGPWRTSRTPYLKGILDAISQERVDQITVMSSAQIGKTEIELNALGYYIHHKPAPILFVAPTVDMARATSNDRIAPMIALCSALRNRIQRGRGKADNLLNKSFDGGHLTLIGANSPAGLASRPIKVLLMDEIDRYPASVGEEGDPVNLAKKRTTTFSDRKIIAVSTPTIKGRSRIEALYNESSMGVYHLPCPVCGHPQALHWSRVDLATAQHACEDCGVLSGQDEWKNQPGEWHHRVENAEHLGFHVNELLSPFKRWEEIIDDYNEAKDDPLLLRTWVNLSQGEPYETVSESVDGDDLFSRREEYAADVPLGGLVLTCAVDVQGNRLEAEVKAWGKDFESWSVDYKILHGDPARPMIWRELDAYLSRKWQHESGVELPIVATCIDSGGHHTGQVYKFVKGKEARRIYAIKGRGGEGVPPVSRPTTRNKEKVKLFTLGVDTLKESVMAWLKVSRPGPGYSHYPEAPLYDPEYFKQLTAEHRVEVFERGAYRRKWKLKTGQKRNEVFDLAVYNLAAITILKPDFKRIELNMAKRAEPEPEPEKRDKRTNNFLNME